MKNKSRFIALVLVLALVFTLTFPSGSGSLYNTMAEEATGTDATDVVVTNDTEDTVEDDTQDIVDETTTEVSYTDTVSDDDSDSDDTTVPVSDTDDTSVVSDDTEEADDINDTDSDYKVSVDDADTKDEIQDNGDESDVENTIEVYKASVDGLTVIASPQKYKAFPIGTRLVVTPITKGASYNAYMQALGSNASKTGKLYDIAFIYDTEEGSFEYQPENGTVGIRFILNDAALKKMGVDSVKDVDVIHLPLADGVVAEGQKTLNASVSASDVRVEELSTYTAGDNTISFNVNSFSSYYIDPEGGETTDVDDADKTRLENFVEDAILYDGDTTVSDPWSVRSDTTYRMVLRFGEDASEGGIQFDTDGNFSYKIPAGIATADNIKNPFTIDVTAGGKTYKLSLNACSITPNGDGTYTINGRFDDQSEGHEYLESATNTKFELEFDVTFAEDANVLDFGYGLTKEVTVDNTNKLTASKSSSYNAATGKAEFTVTVTSKGTNNNIVVNDNISGTSLSYEGITSVKYGDGTDAPYSTTGTQPDNGFNISIDKMTNGQVVIIKYTADVDESVITGKGTFDETSNTVNVNSTDYPDGDTATTSLENQIEYSDMSKKGDASDTVTDGKRTVKWTVTYNSKCIAAMGGNVITDSIASNSRSYMKFDSDMTITVKKTNASGETVSTENVSPTTVSDYTWTYKIPDGDTTPYTYTIEYETTVDVSELTSTINIINDVEDENGFKGQGSAAVGPSDNNKLGISKQVLKTSQGYTDWVITVQIPGLGLPANTQITDTLPEKSWITGGEVRLADSFNEIVSFKLNNDDFTNYNIDVQEGTGPYSADKVVITLPDGIAKNADETPQTLTIVLRSNNDPTWLDYAYNVENPNPEAQTHRNSVKIDGLATEATVDATPPYQKMEKTSKSAGVTQQGYPIIEYSVDIYGITREDLPYIVTDDYDDLLTLNENSAVSYLNPRIGPANAYGTISTKDLPAGSYVNGSGKIVFTLTDDEFEKDSKGDYYSHYKIVYLLYVADEDAFNEIVDAAVKDENCEYYAENKVSAPFGDVTNKQLVYTYDDVASKELVNDAELSGQAIDRLSVFPTYRIVINPEKKELNNGNDIVATDTIVNQYFRYDSIEYETDPAGRSIVYDVSGSTLTLTIPDSTKVVVTYRTDINTKNGTDRGNKTIDVPISNTLTIKGQKKNAGRTVNVNADASGTASHVELTLLKYNFRNMDIKLEGAQFGLYKAVVDDEGKPTQADGSVVHTKSGNVETDIPVIITTDSKGNAIVTDEKHYIFQEVMYYLQEVKAPDGYALNDTKYFFSITKEGDESDFDNYKYERGTELKIRNGYASFEITKTNGSGTKLGGAEFALYTDAQATVPYKDNGVAVTAVSSSDADTLGKVTFNNLPIGTYYLKETKAPTGYELSSEIYTITVSQGATTLEVSSNITGDEIANDLISNKGKIVVNKTVQKNGVKDTSATGTFKVGISKTPNLKTAITDSSMIKEISVASGEGTVTFSELDPDTYYVYELDSSNKPVGNAFGEYVVTGSGTEAVLTATDKNKTVEIVNNNVTTDITATKVWDDADNQDGKRPITVTFVLMRKVGTGNPETFVKWTVYESESWTHTWRELPTKEDGKDIVYWVVEEVVPTDYSDEVTEDPTGVFTITNSHTPELTEASVEKVWDDANNQDGKRPASLVVTLKATKQSGDPITDIADQTFTLNDDNHWKTSVTGLQKFYKGEEVKYVWDEETITGYTKSEETTGTETVITNSYTPGKTNIKVTKAWDDSDDQDGKRPTSVTFILSAKADNKPIEGLDGKEITVSANENWTYTWTNLPLMHEGKEIVYTVDESSVGMPEGYTKAITGDVTNGFTITNSYTPEVVEVNVEKIWNDANDQDGKRPDSLEVTLKARDKDDKAIDGMPDRTVTLNESNHWKYVIGGLPKYHAGELIKYTWSEASVADYTPSVDVVGSTTTFTNSYTPGVTSITATKEWDDEGNQDGKRPTSVTFVLSAKVGTTPVSGIDGDTKTVTANENWTYTWTNLPLMQSGEAVVYSVDEVEVPDGYTKEVTGNVTEGFKITNSYTPEETEATINKIWDDENDSDKKRPGTLKVTLKATVNGQPVSYIPDDEYELNKDNSWSVKVENLPKYSEGKLITYSWTEEDLTGIGYSVTGNETVGTVTTITNSYTPGKTSIKATKNWYDGNDQDGKRPTSVTFVLSAKVGETPVEGIDGDEQTVSATENWTYTWTDLPLKKDGSDIVYSVDEKTVPDGYTKAVTGDASNGFTITNTHTPEETEASIAKVWDDENDNDGKRPGSLKVTLKATVDGSPVTGISDTEVTLNDTNSWTAKVENLPKFNDGKTITYTWTEDSIADYTISSNETVGTVTTITNSYTPGKTSISATKVWDDAENQDGKRPANVTFVLSAKVGTTPVTGLDGDEQTVTATENWSYTWTNLPLKKDGSDIVYSVDEKTVPDGYTKSVTGDVENGFTITNSYTPEKTEAKIVKVWDDDNDRDRKRPASLSVTLKATIDGQPVAGIPDADYVLDKDNSWSVTATDLPKYNGGKLVTYSWTEAAVTDYSISSNETVGTVTTITNSYTPGKTSITATKSWSDANDQDGKRPTSVTFVLSAKVGTTPVTGLDGDEQTVTANENWTYTWTELPLKEDGNDIVYSVDEKTVPDGYTKAVTGDVSNGFTITNSHTPDETEASIAKIWDDENDNDGKRPDSLKVTLKATVDGSPVTGISDTEVTLNDTNSWTAKVENLPKYSGGKTITYTWTEESVAEYTISSDETVGTVTTITNSYTPGKTSITATKVWDDAEDQDGKRPESITFVLSAKVGTTPVTGVDGDEQTVDADDNWAYTWTELPLMKDGSVITYSVSEKESADGYRSSVSGNSQDGFVITNSHTPEVTEASVIKVWEDDDDKEQKRPASLTVTLKAIINDSPVTGITDKTVVLNKDNNWEASVTGLQKYKDGELITYKWTEETIKNYSVKSVDTTGTVTTITNLYTPDKTSFSFTKKGLINEKCSSDPDAVKPLKGVEFSARRILPDGTYSSGTITVTSDADGLVLFDQVTGGLYEIKEESTVDNYILDDNTYYVDTEKGNILYTDKECTTPVSNNVIINDKPRGDIKIVKVSEINKDEKLPDSEYILTKVDEDGKEVIVARTVTDENGVIFFEGVFLDEEYTVKEVKSPDGYYVSEEPVIVKVIKDSSTGDTVVTVVDDGSGTVYVDDDGNIKWAEPAVIVEFNKVDENKQPVKGAALEVRDEDGNVVKGEDGKEISWVTDGNTYKVTGVFTVGKIYKLVETAAPDGYEIADPVSFTIDDNEVGPNEGKVITVTMVDKEETTNTTSSSTTDSTTETSTSTTTVTTTSSTTTVTTQTSTTDTKDKITPKKTSDDSPVALLMIIIGLCLLAISMIIMYKKRLNMNR